MTGKRVPEKALFAALVSSFALWGLLNNMTDNLVPMFSAAWDSDLKLSQMSLRASFVVPTICFVVVFAYSLAFRGGRPNQKHP